MKKVLVLGERGMLGDAVYKYFASQSDYEVLTISERWPSVEFMAQIKESDVDFIINCIGKIPQRKPTEDGYLEANVDLPVFLETLGISIIHPSTDCEFSGSLSEGLLYTKKSKRDAEDTYGRSKALISEKIETTFKNTKIIRTSIIGHEPYSHVSLLDWFLNSEDEVKGYTNHFWNGITTLEWAHLAHDLMENWEHYPTLNQYGTKDTASKYSVLCTIKEVYNKNIVITAFEAPTSANKCLESDKEILPLTEQLKELKRFYNK